MAILIGVIALAVIPNIQRSRESKDISALDSIASAANAAIATTQAKGSGVVVLGTTANGVTDEPNPGNDEKKKIQHAVFDSVAAGAGKVESDNAAHQDGNASNATSIVLYYDTPNKKVCVAYTNTTNPSSIADLQSKASKCKYLDGQFVVTN